MQNMSIVGSNSYAGSFELNKGLKCLCFIMHDVLVKTHQLSRDLPKEIKNITYMSTIFLLNSLEDY